MTAATKDYWSQLSASMVDQVIGDEYQLLEELGRGSYGCLFLGQSLKDGSYVAVKILTKMGLDQNQLQVQQQEADIQSSLKHPHILSLHRVIQNQDFIFMVMELCDQGDLFDYVVRCEVGDDFVMNAFRQILEAVEYMHVHKAYHRDIKLENILLKTGEHDSLECKVADFGLATRERFSMDFGCGSTSYLAPEHFADADDENQDDECLLVYDAAASDVWSLGILLLALLFGRSPWEEANALDPSFAEYCRNPSMLKRVLFPTLSMRCFRFLTHVLSPNPADRPSLTEMKHQFLAMDHLTIDPETDDESDSDTMSMDNDYCWPVTIPNQHVRSDKASFDSAIFSGTYRGLSGESWSGIVEQDKNTDSLAFEHNAPLLSSAIPEEEDDTDMFIHSQEKESWWL